MKTLSDHELVELIKTSNYKAFNELHCRSWKFLYHLALKKTGSQEDAFDLVQDLFLEIWEKRLFLPVIVAPVIYYFRAILIFKLARFFRTQGFKDKHEKNFEEFLKSDLSSLQLSNPSDLQEEELKKEGLLQLVNSLIEEMPNKMKEVFLLSRSGKYSILELAEMLDLSPQTVKNQISNALSKLRKIRIDNLIFNL